MSAIGNTESVTADYDDAPSRRVGNPLVRLIRAAGALGTVLIAGSLAALLDVGVHPPVEVFVVGVIISVASIPLIMLFWSEEVVWKGGRLSVLGTLVAISMLTWFAEVLLSVIILFLAGAVLG